MNTTNWNCPPLPNPIRFHLWIHRIVSFLSGFRFFFRLTRRLLILTSESSKSSLQRAALVPNGELKRFVVVGVPLGLIADDGRIKDARLNPQEGHVRWRQAPLGQKLDGLRIITKSLFQHFPKVFENCEPESAQTCAGTAQPWAWT